MNMTFEKKPMILVSGASNGYGHIRAGEVIKDELLTRLTDCDVRFINIYNYFSKLERIILENLWSIASIAPIIRDVYRYLHREISFQNGLSSMYQSIFKRCASRILKYEIGKRPILGYIATHPATVSIGVYLKQFYNLELSVIATDFVLHGAHCHSLVNNYFVPPGFKVVGRNAEKVVRAGKVKITGIPISSEFSIARPKAEQIAHEKDPERTGLNAVVTFGANGLGANRHLGDIVKLLRSNLPIRMTIICGHNDSFKSRIQKRVYSLGLQSRVKIYGFRNDLPTILSNSDLVIGKVGGLTISESMSLGLPTAAIEVLPGQEDYNMQALIDCKAGIKIERPVDLISWIDQLLNRSELLKWRQYAFNGGTPESVRLIIDHICSSIQETCFICKAN